MRGEARGEERRRRDAERLDADILAAIGGGWSDPPSELEFDRLARAVFAHQLRFNPVYRRFCELRGISASADVASWREVPPVPTGAFKVGRWATFPPAAEAVAFRTSGTSEEGRGVHRLDTLSLANAAIVTSARRFVVPDRERIRCLFLSPAPAAAPDSSLVHMFAVYREAFGAPGSGFLLTRPPVALPEVVAEALDMAAGDGDAVLVAGAALAFHGVLSALGEARWSLPPGSRALVTGGFKGLARVTDPEALAGSIVRRLGIPVERQVEEYGMTELSSQYYDARLRETVGDPDAESPGFLVPPWARVRVVDPLSGRDIPVGEQGVVVHVDLANRGSAVAIQTSDLGFARSDGRFLLAGRAPGAEARGCSLAAELWLDRT